MKLPLLHCTVVEVDAGVWFESPRWEHLHAGQLDSGTISRHLNELNE